MLIFPVVSERHSSIPSITKTSAHVFLKLFLKSNFSVHHRNVTLVIFYLSSFAVLVRLKKKVYK